MISISELKKHLQLVENIAEELKLNINEEQSDFIVLKNSTIKICVFLYLNKELLLNLDKDFIKNFNYLFVITDEITNEIYDKKISFINFITIKNIYESLLFDNRYTKNVLIKVFSNNYNYILNSILSNSSVIKENIVFKNNCQTLKNYQEVSLSNNHKNCKFLKEEAAVLLDGYLRIRDGEKAKIVIEETSNLLREYALSKSMEISDNYRNINGIRSQMYYMKQAYEENAKGSDSIPYIFMEVVDMFKNDNKQYENLLKLVKHSEVINEKEEKQIMFLDYDKLNVDILTYTKPLKYEFLGCNREVCSWTEIYVDILRILYALDNSVIVDLIGESILGINSIDISLDPSKLNSAKKIEDDIYLETKYNPYYLILRLMKVFEKYNINIKDLIITYEEIEKEKKGMLVDGDIWITLMDGYSSDLNYSVPKIVEFLGECNKTISTWKSVYLFVLRKLISKNKNIILNNLDKSLVNSNNIDFTKNTTSLRRPINLIDDIYVETNFDVQQILSRLEKLLDLYEISLSSLKILCIVKKEKTVNKNVVLNNNENTNKKNDVVLNTTAEVKSKYIESEDLKAIRNNILDDYASLGHKTYRLSNDEYILFLESKEYDLSNCFSYWYTIHKYQIDVLQEHNSFIILYFKTKGKYAKLPFSLVKSKFDKLDVTVLHGENNYHIHIDKMNENYYFRIPNEGRLNIDQYIYNITKQELGNVSIADNKLSLKEMESNNKLIKIKSNFMKAVNFKK